MPQAVNSRRVSALTRLESLPPTPDRAKEIATLKSRICAPSGALGIRTKKDRRGQAKVGRN